ncbi:hypothetical protein ACEYX6_02090 [Acinetobacter sp. c2-A9]|uniref:hypothetical protein n=1 Tax=Acinetobacter sp. c2-A9 TaxID=3342802 RepID=UPI0035BADF74
MQYTVHQLCKADGGVTVYVTPEEWRQQIGEKEWLEMKPFTNDEIYQTKNTLKYFEFDGVIYNHYDSSTYLKGNLENSRVKEYYKSTYINKHIFKSEHMVVDISNQKALVRFVGYTKTSKGIAELSDVMDLFLGKETCPEKFDESYYAFVKQYSNY